MTSSKVSSMLLVLLLLVLVFPHMDKALGEKKEAEHPYQLTTVQGIGRRALLGFRPSCPAFLCKPKLPPNFPKGPFPRPRPIRPRPPPPPHRRFSKGKNI
ncbi:unnamed protein product [Brassica rapa]|uniref:Transmembrane protein n=1 Tax=Brassica campestris TaxID=3711 RepID=A0A8D9LPG0_BRACM|nr:unnamed protein product [Brassica rapa]